MTEQLIEPTWTDIMQPNACSHVRRTLAYF